MRESPHGNACCLAGLLAGWFCGFDRRWWWPGLGARSVRYFSKRPPGHTVWHQQGCLGLGTAIATVQYSKRVQMRWHALAPAAIVCFAASLGGAWLVTVVSPQYLRKALPAVLVLVLGYTLAKKQLGRDHVPRFVGQREALVASAIGAVIGFYDGFFGPGTGSFFVFLIVRVLGYDFLNASASAKLLNTASNLAAILLFAVKGYVWWHFVLVMAIANVLGSVAGTHLALKHGTGFVRGVFIAVVSALILKTSYDAFLR